MTTESLLTSTVLVIEDERFSRQFLSHILMESGCKYIGVATIKEGKAFIEAESSLDLILLDVRLPDGNGLEFFKWISEYDSMVPVIIISAYGSIEDAVGAIKGGAYDFITKPFEGTDKMRNSIKNAIDHGRLKRENALLRARLNSPKYFQNIIGKSKQMEQIYCLIQKSSQSKINVMIEGASGTGKELIAKAIHDLSARKDMSFVPVNCGALPENLLEAALFGHEKGSFTGADKMTKGFFEAADGGTLFLDEIGDSPLSVQVKILRAIEYGTIYRVGSTKPINIDVRFLFATHKDLKKEIEAGRFREDLYFRINVIDIRLPSLDERREDIPMLIKYFTDKTCLEVGVEKKEYSDEAYAFLCYRQWNGNVRELKNFIERVVALHSGKLVSLEELNAIDQRSINKTHENHDDVEYEKAKCNFEKKYFEKVISLCNGDYNAASEISGVHKATIYRKIKELKIKIMTHK